MAIRHEIRLEVLSDPKLLKPVRGLIRAYLENLGFSAGYVDAAVLAIDEACANAIRHSYNGCTDRPLTLCLGSDGAGIEIVLDDEGVPAPAERLRRKKPAVPHRKALTPGGLGVQIMYEVFDEVEFCPGRERGNCVTMRLKLPDKSRQGAGM